jgi:hypothetical protein
MLISYQQFMTLLYFCAMLRLFYSSDCNSYLNFETDCSSMHFLCVLFISNSIMVRNSSSLSVISSVKSPFINLIYRTRTDAKRKSNEWITDIQRMETEQNVNVTYIHRTLYAVYVRPKF